MAKKKSTSDSHGVGVGVGLTAAAVTAAGAYFLYGSKNAPKNRKMVKSWMLKAKAEVLEQLEKAQHMTEEEYGEAIDKIAAAYGRLRGVSKSELATFKREMKSHWKQIKRSGKAVKTSAKKKAKRTVKKAKKVTKKAVRKKSRSKKRS